MALQTGLQQWCVPLLQYKDICYGGAPADYQDSESLSQAFPTMSLQFAQVRRQGCVSYNSFLYSPFPCPLCPRRVIIFLSLLLPLACPYQSAFSHWSSLQQTWGLCLATCAVAGLQRLRHVKPSSTVRALMTLLDVL